MSQDSLVLDHLVIISSDVSNLVIRVNLITTAVHKLLRGMKSYEVVKSDISGEGCVEILIPSCERAVVGGIAPGSVTIEIEKVEGREVKCQTDIKIPEDDGSSDPI